MVVPAQHMIKLLGALAPLSKATGILDLGCGPANTTTQFISTCAEDINTEALILAGDFSPGMVRQATQFRRSQLADLPTGKERDIWNRLTPIVLDATDMHPLLDNSLTHIFANQVFMLTSDPHKAVAEAYRVLSPDGVLACTSWHKLSWIHLIYLAATRVFSSQSGKQVPSEPQMPADWATVEAVTAILSKGGFRDVQVEYVDTAMVVEQPESWARTFIESENPAVNWVTARMNEEEAESLKAHLASVIRETCQKDGNGGFRLGGTAVVAAGRK